MFNTKEVKISEDFGKQYVEGAIELIKEDYEISFIGIQEVEIDLIYYNYLINGNKVSFISETMAGTSIHGPRKIIKELLKKIKNPNSTDYKSVP